MTCFWDGILHHLKEDDFERVFNCKKNNTRTRTEEFVKLLQIKIKETKKDKYIIQSQDIRWNGEELSKQQIDEIYIHITEYNEKSVYGGYFCSTCDPFLIYICILFNVNINHNYCGYEMKYTNKNAKRTLKFKSNRGHFWAI